MTRRRKDEDRPLLSLVIPAYNEEDIIGETIDEVVEYLDDRGIGYEVIVVSDGSKDRTAEVVLERAKKHRRLRLIGNDTNSGKGFSVRQGCLAARGEVVVFTDADLSYPISEVEKPLELITSGKADVAIGSRTARGAMIQAYIPPLRRLMSKVFNLFVRIIAIKGIYDTQCGFKAFSGEAAHAIFSRQTMTGFSFDVEVIYIARKLGYRVVEFPIHWARSSESSVNPVTDSAKMFLDIIRIRLIDLRGGYERGEDGR